MVEGAEVNPQSLKFAPIFSRAPFGVGFGAIFLLLVLLAAVTDVRVRRIPNVLVLALLLAGFCYSIATQGIVAGVSQAFFGTLTGLAIWLGFYVVGVLGAGDVKFFAAAASWLGAALAWRAALVSAAFGGLLAIVFLWRASRLGATAHRLALIPFMRSGGLATVRDMSPDGAKQQLPYGVALGAGVVVMSLFPALLG